MSLTGHRNKVPRVTLVLIGLLLLGLTSCTTTLVANFGDSSDHWRIWIDKVVATRWDVFEGYVKPDAPKTCDYGWVHKNGNSEWESTCSAEPSLPADGHRYLRVVLTIRNIGTEPRAFDLSAVRLGGDDVERIASILDMNRGFNWLANPHPELDPGEEITRKLFFQFPEELKPDRLSAEGMTLAFPVSAEHD
jgi:hypothetical protein